MSNPPVPPSNPDGPEPGQQPAPGPGQGGPQYGQQAPPPPAYGQQPPSAPQYGQQGPQGPQYGQPPSAPQYGQVAPQLPQYGQQSPQFGKSGYGQSPYAQYPSEQPAAPSATRPPQVDLAFWLIIAAGVLSAISGLVLAFGGGDYFQTMMRDEAARQGQQLPPGALDGLRPMMAVGGIIGVLISLGLYALVAFPVRNGKNWARILGTVFAAISILGLFGGSFALGPVYGVLQIVSILLGIAGIVLLYLPDASRYFQKRQPFANPYGQPGAPFGK